MTGSFYTFFGKYCVGVKEYQVVQKTVNDIEIN